MTAAPNRRRPALVLCALAASALAASALAACGGGASSESGVDGPGVAAAGPPEAQTVTVDSTDELVFVPARVTAARAR